MMPACSISPRIGPRTRRVGARPRYRRRSLSKPSLRSPSSRSTQPEPPDCPGCGADGCRLRQRHQVCERRSPPSAWKRTRMMSSGRRSRAVLASRCQTPEDGVRVLLRQGLPVDIDERRQANILVLAPVGRIDNLTSAEFQTRLLAAVTSNSADVVVDLSGVEYISSAGLRALMTASRQKPKERRLAVA